MVLSSTSFMAATFSKGVIHGKSQRVGKVWGIVRLVTKNGLEKLEQKVSNIFFYNHSGMKKHVQLSVKTLVWWFPSQISVLTIF